MDPQGRDAMDDGRISLQRSAVLVSAFGLGTLIQAGTLSKDPTGSIQGTITFGGYPLPTGRLLFHPAGAPPKSAKLKDGIFKMDGIPAGSLRVSIDAGKYQSPIVSTLSWVISSVSRL